MLSASGQAALRFWHLFGLGVHLLLGTANLIYWVSFVQLDVITMGIVTTVLHGLFVCAQAICLWDIPRAGRPSSVMTA